MNYCLYYQATIERSRCWFFTSIVRSYEHLCFDRTIDAQASVFEFFVPKDNERLFLSLMEYCASIGLASNIQKLPNRLALESENSY